MSKTHLYAVVLLSGVMLASQPHQLFAADIDPSDDQIERILEQKQDMMFKDATLDDLASFLVAAGIPTFIDRRALDDVGLGTDAPLAFRQHSIRLRDGLTLALRLYDLTWTVRRGRLIITTPEEEEVELITRVYDVRHLVELVPVENWGGYYGNEVVSTSYYYDFDSLLNTITSTIRPETWDEVGGGGSIEPYYTRRMRVLIVSQTYDVHKQLSALLRELTRLGGTKALTPPVVKSSRSRIRDPHANAFGPAVPSHTTIRSSQLRTTGQ